ncbi:hypothetical protein [Sorangium sp. So ce131]|uniref:hypothetical protein n=1 Tax=Sorangium sp. So ce131 TaxID=3133282 RepID=UPI003F602418
MSRRSPAQSSTGSIRRHEGKAAHIHPPLDEEAMKISFSWTSGHSSLHIRYILADGAGVKIIESGQEKSPPAQVKRGDKLHVSDRYVAYGSSSAWAIGVVVDDPATNTAMKGLTITAHYDHAPDPSKTEDLCKNLTVAPNAVEPVSKTITIPRRPQ